jgi:hypothetical protein
MSFVKKSPKMWKSQPKYKKTLKIRGGSGLIFLGLGRAWVEAFGLWLLKFKIRLEAFKSLALVMGLKICKKL